MDHVCCELGDSPGSGKTIVKDFAARIQRQTPSRHGQPRTGCVTTGVLHVGSVAGRDAIEQFLLFIEGYASTCSRACSAHGFKEALNVGCGARRST